MTYTIYLVGDAGDPQYEGAAEVLAVLDSMMAQTAERSSVVFLGDNLYPSGMPPSTSPEREEAEKKIDELIRTAQGHPGEVVFVPGNHDWGGAGLGGDREAVIRQENYIEARLERDAWLPDRGFPGPVSLDLTDDIALIIIDTQWWLEEVKPYGNTGTYDLEHEGEFLLELDDVLWRNADKHRVVVGHHPVFTNGEHGGRFKGLRSLLVGERLARGYLGTPQDLSNLKYRRLRDGLLTVFQHHRDLVYAAGHEHNLQYFAYNDQHYVVSGSGSKLGHVEDGYGALFAEEVKGFADLRYFTDGSIWLSFYSATEDTTAELLYTQRIREPSRPLVARWNVTDGGPTYASTGDVVRADTASLRRVLSEGLAGPIDTVAFAGTTEEQTGLAELPDTVSGSDGDDPRVEEAADPESTTSGREPNVADPADSGTKPGAPTPPYTLVSGGTTTVTAGEQYQVGSLAESILGEHYRDIWSMPVTVPIIDLEKTAGGLTPLQKGGGLQTVSLRLQGADGDQYVLRSIDKDPTASIPEYLRETIAHDVVQDQIAAIHPYAAFTIPKMAEAAGVYHTHPTLVYIPDDPRLGFYRNVFAGMLALFETRPDEDQSDEARFGYAENVIGSPKLFEEIVEDNDERVDERAFARARLFDMIIGDWDRHKDQWRWAEFDVTPGKIYRPIPRDRDFAFFKFDGLLPNIIRKSGDLRFRRLTNFETAYSDILGLNFNGAAMDRRFTSSLSEADWLEIADSLHAALTDEVIDEAMRDFPAEVYNYHGENIAKLLKERRDLIHEAASEYYRLLAKNVDIVGSNKHERFEVSRLNDDSTLVVMYKTKKEGKIDRELLRRVLYTRETEEVRLYGLGGNDYFKVTGNVRSGIRVRAIGGDESDTFVDSSRVAGVRNHTIFHDTVEGDEWITSSETEIIRSNEQENNEYEMLRFELDERHPLFHVSRNTDDGVLLGGGIKIIQSGFRKDPYASQHRIFATAATKRRVLNAHYRGHFVNEFGQWDGFVEADLYADRNFRNFYGFGNDTDLDDRFFYHARIGRVILEPTLQKRPLPFTTVRFGPRFELTSVSRPEDPVRPTLFSPGEFTDRYYVGARADLHIDGTDTLAATQHGARWLSSVSANLGIRNTNNFFVRLGSEINYFYTFYNPKQITLGMRAGGATNVGDFEFYQANTLGGQSNLRGFRKTRFAGRTALFANLDVRVQLLDFNVYLMRGVAGVLGFYDVGRVWDGRLNFNVLDLHHGYGGGIWIAPFNKLAFTAALGVSEENTLFDLSFGFQF